MRTAAHPKPAWNTRRRKAAALTPNGLFIILLFVFWFFLLHFCALLAHDAGHLWTYVVYEDLHTDVKSKYLGAGGNPIRTALERVTKFVFLLNRRHDRDV